MRIISWEYKQIILSLSIGSKEVMKLLNDQGRLGWELIQVRERTYKSNNLEQKKLVFLLKRPVGTIAVNDLS